MTLRLITLSSIGEAGRRYLRTLASLIDTAIEHEEAGNSLTSPVNCEKE
jgi:hypothetical protein